MTLSPAADYRLRRIARGLGVVFLLVGIALAVGIWRSANESAPEESASGSAAPRIVSRAALDEALTVVAAGDEAVPRDRWDPAYVAELLGPDPQMHLRWVRERSVWIPYRGALRGAAGVLMDGQGNSLDRALLLAALLSRAGHTARLAHGELSAEEASRLLPVLVARRRQVADGPRHTASPDAWRGELIQVTQAYDLDAPSLRNTVGSRLDEVTRMLRTVERRTEQQTARLRDALGTQSSVGGHPDRTQRALADLRDHWWVQYQTPQGWTDLDILGDSLGQAHVTTGETVAPDALDSALHHRVVVRLVTERLASGTLVETRALEHGFRPIDVLGKSITLQILPESWQPGMIEHAADPAGALRALALEQEAWHATLSLGKETVAVAVLEHTGKVAAPGGGGPLGGLGIGIVGALGSGKGSGELSAAWLEYEVQRPGATPSIVRRQLFDLVGPAARAAKRPIALEVDAAGRLERSLALFRTTDMLLLAGGIAPEYLTHLAATAVVANADLLRQPGPPDGSSTPALMDHLNERAALPPSPLYALAVVRILAEPGQDAYIDQANVLSQHDFLVAREHGIVRVKVADIVANDVGVALDARSPADTRRRQGVRDTNAEALVYGTPVPETSVAEAYASGGRWVTITSPNDTFLGTLLPDIQQRMRDDLGAGYAIVAPADAAHGWWRTDPHTGHTLGVSSTGWGMTMVERAAEIMGAVAVGWTFEYLICSGAIPGIGSRNTVASAPSPLDWVVRPLHAAATAREDPCLWEAWKAGILAGAWASVSVAWPFILKMFPSLKFFDRPLFASGDVAPGDPLPIFGKPPAQPPPPEKCPPAGAAPGAAEGATPAEGPPPEEEVGPQEPASKPGEAPAEEPVQRPEGGDPRPFDEQWGDMPPQGSPEEMAETVRSAEASAAEAAAKIGPARTRLEQAQAAVKEAEQELAAADAAAAADQNSLEAGKRARDAAAALEKAQAQHSNAHTDVNRLERAQAIAARQRRLQPLNDALYQARADVRLARARFARDLQEGRVDFEGDEYRALQQVTDRYEKARKAWSDANQLGRVRVFPAVPAPGGGGGGTVAMPDRPLPGPGQTQPLETPGAPPPAGPSKTQPRGEGPTYPACPQASSPPPGSPPPGQPRPGGPLAGSPKGAPVGKAPKGNGPFQGDPDNRDWLRKNWNPDPKEAHDVAGALGDPKIYDNADQAALARYNQARKQGMDDQGARQESWEEWWNSVQNARQAQGIGPNPVRWGREWVGPNPYGQTVAGTGATAGGK